MPNISLEKWNVELGKVVDAAVSALRKQRSGIQGYPWLHSETEASLDYT